MAVLNQTLKCDIKSSVKELFGDKDKYHRIDIEELSTIVVNYVFDSSPAINDANRYQAYYQLLGKAIAIAQGWKQNCSETIKLPSQTQNSIENYIINTYGFYKQPSHELSDE